MREQYWKVDRGNLQHHHGAFRGRVDLHHLARVDGVEGGNAQFTRPDSAYAQGPAVLGKTADPYRTLQHDPEMARGTLSDLQLRCVCGGAPHHHGIGQRGLPLGAAERAQFRVPLQHGLGIALRPASCSCSYLGHL